jgi:vacuolar-type H+-ATPase subunit F/Vma7
VSGGWAIGDAPTVRGFELAGFHGVVAETSGAVRAAVEQAREQGVRLAVVSERAAALAPDVLDARGALRTLVVAVPSLGREHAAPAGERVRRIVRGALGVPESARVGRGA